MDTTHAPLLPLTRMARTLRVTSTWLRAEADAGRLPHIRAGRQYLFAPEAVIDVLADRARQGVAHAE